MADDESFELSGDLDDLLNEDSSAALDLDADIISDSASVSGIDPVESELDEPAVESAVDLVDDADDLDEEAEDKKAKTVVAAPKRRNGLLSDFTIFDAMLVFSLLLVTSAALMMAWGLNDYGSVFGLPWKTTGITVK
jgi:hypothetical protein